MQIPVNIRLAIAALSLTGVVLCQHAGVSSSQPQTIIDPSQPLLQEQQQQQRPGPSDDSVVLAGLLQAIGDGILPAAPQRRQQSFKTGREKIRPSSPKAKRPISSSEESSEHRVRGLNRGSSRQRIRVPVAEVPEQQQQQQDSRPQGHQRTGPLVYEKVTEQRTFDRPARHHHHQRHSHNHHLGGMPSSSHSNNQGSDFDGGSRKPTASGHHIVAPLVVIAPNTEQQQDSQQQPRLSKANVVFVNRGKDASSVVSKRPAAPAVVAVGSDSDSEQQQQQQALTAMATAIIGAKLLQQLKPTAEKEKPSMQKQQPSLLPTFEQAAEQLPELSQQQQQAATALALASIFSGLGTKLPINAQLQVKPQKLQPLTPEPQQQPTSTNQQPLVQSVPSGSQVKPPLQLTPEQQQALRQAQSGTQQPTAASKPRQTGPEAPKPVQSPLAEGFRATNHRYHNGQVGDYVAASPSVALPVLTADPKTPPGILPPQPSAAVFERRQPERQDSAIHPGHSQSQSTAELAEQLARKEQTQPVAEKTNTQVLIPVPKPIVHGVVPPVVNPAEPQKRTMIQKTLQKTIQKTLQNTGE